MEDFQRKEIPDEIVVDILSRLPVKSLMRFWCVSKRWLSLRYDKHFINMRVKRNTGFIISYGKVVERQCEQNFVILEEDGATPTHKFKFKIHSHVDHVLPSCNGLICLYGRKGGTPIYLCNPSTREVVSLPPTSAITNDFSGGFNISLGFGFDPLAEQYKVVKLINPHSGYPVSHCEVLTVGDESWRKIGNPPFRLDGYPVFVQGFLHWTVSDVRKRDEWIVSFDVGAEKFGVIPHPECYDVKRRYFLYLQVLGGYLCIFDRDFEDTNCIIDLWILEDYSARTWVKERIVLPAEEKFFLHRVVAMAAMINGEILLRTVDRRLISYNLKSKSFRKVDMEGQSSLFNFTISSHVESLTPILRGAI